MLSTGELQKLIIKDKNINFHNYTFCSILPFPVSCSFTEKQNSYSVFSFVCTFCPKKQFYYIIIISINFLSPGMTVPLSLEIGGEPVSILFLGTLTAY